MPAQAVPELLGEEAPREQHWSGEIEQGPEAGVLLDGQVERVPAVRALSGQEGRALSSISRGWEPSQEEPAAPRGAGERRAVLPLQTRLTPRPPS